MIPAPRLGFVGSMMALDGIDGGEARDMEGERVRSGKHKPSRSGWAMPLSTSGVDGSEMLLYIGADVAEKLVLEEVVVDAVVDVCDIKPLALAEDIGCDILRS